jgi:hypothetical protein
MAAKKKKKRNGVVITPFSSEGSELLGAFLEDLNNIHNDTVIPEFRFFPERGWRADYAIPRRGVLLEYEGLPSRYRKSRHTTRAGYVKDIEKYNKAATLGLVVLRYHWDSVSKDTIETDLTAVLESRKPDKICATCEHPFCSYLIGALVPLDKALLPLHLQTHDFLKCQVCCYIERKAKDEWDVASALFSSRSPHRIKFIAKRKSDKQKFYDKGKELLSFVFLSWGVWSDKLKASIDLENLIETPDEEKIQWLENKIQEIRKQVEDLIGWPLDSEN